MMDQAFETFLSKPARKHPHQKDKPEPCMEQGQCKETMRQRGFHNQMSTEILTTSETVFLHKKQWIQTSVSKNSWKQNQKALNVLNARLRTPPNTG